MATDFNEQFKKYYEANKGEHDTEADKKAKEINYKDYFNQKLQNANLRALSQKYFRANMENSGLLGTGEMVSANLRNDQYYNNLDNANFENMQARNNAITQQGITNYENGLNADIEKYIGYMQQFSGNKVELDKALRDYGLLDSNGTWNKDKAAMYGADRMKDLQVQYDIATGANKDINVETGKDEQGNPITSTLSNGISFNSNDIEATKTSIKNLTIGQDWSSLEGLSNNTKKKGGFTLGSGTAMREEVNTMVNLVNDGLNHDGEVFFLNGRFGNNVGTAFIYKNGSFFKISPDDFVKFAKGDNYTYISGGKVKNGDKKTINSTSDIKGLIY